MSDELQPKSTATLRGDTRTLQYYCLREGWEWHLSEKTRSTTEAMQAAWGHELDIVTMLGCEPRPVKRDWRRFEESREIVDAGRSRKVAERILGALKDESEREQRLRKTANNDLLTDLEEGFNKRIKRYADSREAFAEHIVNYTPPYIADEYDRLVGFYYIAEWVTTLKIALDHERARPKGQLLRAMLQQADYIRAQLVSGSWERKVTDLEDLAYARQVHFGRKWLIKLTRHDGLIARYRAWEKANDTLNRRKVDDVAAKLKKLGSLGKLG